MQENNRNDEILSKLSILFQEPKLIQVSICGSRGKGIYSLDSDQDLKGVFIQSKKQQMLNQTKDTIQISFNTIDGTLVEGSAIDIIKLIEQIAFSNQYIVEMFLSTNIYSNDLAISYKEFFLKSFAKEKYRYNLKSILSSRVKKHLDTKLSNKELLEQFSIALKIDLMIQNDMKQFPDQNVDKNMESQFELQEEQDLLKSKRILDKEEFSEEQKGIVNFISTINNKNLDVVDLKSMNKDVKLKGEEIFLDYYEIL